MAYRNHKVFSCCTCSPLKKCIEDYHSVFDAEVNNLLPVVEPFFFEVFDVDFALCKAVGPTTCYSITSKLPYILAFASPGMITGQLFVICAFLFEVVPVFELAVLGALCFLIILVDLLISRLGLLFMTLNLVGKPCGPFLRNIHLV